MAGVVAATLRRATARVLVLGLAVLLGLGAGSPGRAAARGTVLPRGPLRPDGRWLKDRSGRVVIIHGLQVAHKTAPYHPPADSFGPADARLIRRLGFDAVRLAWFWRGLEPERGRFDDGYLKAIADAGRLLAAHDIFLLVESHQDVYGDPVRGAGFPDWATETDGVPQGPDAGFPGNYLAPDTGRAFDNLWANRDGLWDAYAEAWRRVAGAFRREPMLLGYDLFNEPWPGTQWPSCAQPAGCPAFDTRLLGPLQDALAAGVRRADRRGIVFYEPHLLFDFGVASSLGRPPRAAGPAGLSFHDYCLGYGAAQAAPPFAGPAGLACPQLDALVFRNAESTAAAMGVPPLFSEFGDTDDLDVIERSVELADASMTGWMYWGYKDWVDVPGGAGHGSLFADDGNLATINRAKVAVLSRPYPMAVAGTPLGFGFDRATRRMQLRYRPDPAVRAPTVVFVPGAPHYPDGYAVDVAGARVTSRPCARHLALALRRGAREVRVIVRPGRCRARRRV